MKHVFVGAWARMRATSYNHTFDVRRIFIVEDPTHAEIRHTTKWSNGWFAEDRYEGGVLAEDVSCAKTEFQPEQSDDTTQWQSEALSDYLDTNPV